MIRWFLDLLYGEVPAEFASAFGLEESVQRLSAATRRSVFSAFLNQTAVGTVRADRVSLQRVIPFCGNSFKPFFTGSFQVVNGRVILSGTFTMLWWVKIFQSFWFAFCLLGSVLSILPTFRREPDAWWLPLACLGLFAAGVALVWFGKWLSRNDFAWLSAVIRDTLTIEPSGDTRRVNVPQTVRG
jgi:hypothetical protein